MAPKAAAAATEATEVDFASMDLDDGADKVSDAEALAVLKECGLGGPPPKKGAIKSADEALIASLTGGKKDAAPSPPAPTPEAAAPTIGSQVDDRVKEYQRAAVTAKQEGRAEDALLWLRRSKDLRKSAQELLSLHPPCEQCAVDAAVVPELS